MKTRPRPRLPAESYAVSADGLTYTFLLRKDMLWSDGKRRLPLTIFSLPFSACSTRRRSLLPAVNFTCIRGSSAALSGEGSVQDIGVTARMTIRWSFLWNI